ncbi:MAG: DUF362 domain-containing protein [Promethearchaeota archaeon]
MTDARVSVVQIKKYATLKDAVLNAIDLVGGFQKLFRKGEKVLLKPNMLMAKEGVFTDPRLIKELILLAKEDGAEVLVGDSPGGEETLTKSKEQFRAAGILEIINKTGAKFASFETAGPVELEIKNARRLKETLIAPVFFEADAIINIPKWKTHMQTVYTGAIKNFWGIQPGARKVLNHLKGRTLEEFSEVLADLYSVINGRPILNVMDVIQAMVGMGPSSGKMVNVNAIIAGFDAVAVDAVAVAMAGYEPLAAVPHIRICHERGLGIGDLRRIEIVGDGFPEEREKLSLPSGAIVGISSTFLGEVFHRYMKKIPLFLHDRCTQCGTCAENCPVSAIGLTPYPEVDRKTCVNCLCCFELCPYRAIDVKRAGIRGIIGLR